MTVHGIYFSALMATLASLPGEILTEIVTLTLASENLVNLERFVKMGRELGKKRLKRNGQRPLALWTSRRWWLENLPLSQHEHLKDWYFVNSTCRRWRAFGKQLFYAHKRFIIAPHFLEELESNGWPSGNLNFAKAEIRDVQALLPYGEALRGLSRYYVFPSLQRLNIKFLTSLKKFMAIQLPEYLLDYLKAVGLRVDELHMDLVVPVLARERDLQLGWLQQVVTLLTKRCVY